MQLKAPQVLGPRPIRRATEKAVKSLTARMYPVCVFGAKPRIVMSSVMRCRNGLPWGLMGLSVMGLLLS